MASGLVNVAESTIQGTAAHGVLVAGPFGSSNAGTIDSSRLVGGVLSEPDSPGVTVTNSRLVDVDNACGEAGIAVIDSTVVRGTGFGGWPSCTMVASGDRFIGPGSGTAVVLGDWLDSSVTDTVFTGWDTAVAINPYFTVTVTGNTFVHNVTGVASCAGPTYCNLGGGTITGNRFVDNSGTGLLLNAGTWTVGSNIALRNGGLGIDAEPVGSDTLTITDLGGDIAQHNQPPQCIGVVCTPNR
jgi:hypothetical protein